MKYSGQHLTTIYRLLIINCIVIIGNELSITKEREYSLYAEVYNAKQS